MPVFTDGKVHKAIGDVLKLFGFYAPFFFVVAPLDLVLIGVLVVLMILALVLKLAKSVPIWISSLVCAAIILACQFAVLGLRETKTYFVACNALSITCFIRHQREVLGEQVEVWPYHADLPIFGDYKKIWTRNAVGQQRFDDYQLRVSGEGAASRIVSPLEQAVFDFLGGTQDLEGVRIPYRSSHTSLSVSPEISIFSDIAGGGALSFGFGVSPKRRKAVTYRVNLQRSSADFSFSTIGAPMNAETWFQAIRNDLWMAKLPFENADRLVEKLQSTAVELSRSEKLLLNSLELYSWCREAESFDQVIGCRSRLAQLKSAQISLTEDDAPQSKLVAQLLTKTVKHASIRSRRTGVNSSGAQDATGAQPEIELRALEPPSRTLYGRSGASTLLELALRERFPDTQHDELDEQALCRNQAFEAFYDQSVSVNFFSLMENFQAIADCRPEEKAGFLDELVFQPEEAFRDTIETLSSDISEAEWHQYAVELLLHIDDALGDRSSVFFRKWFELFSDFQTLMRHGLLYDPRYVGLVAEWNATLDDIETLSERRAIILDVLGDISPRVHEFISGDTQILERRQRSVALQKDIAQWLEAAVAALHAAHPESSGTLKVDFDRLIEASPEPFDIATLDPIVGAIGRAADLVFLDREQAGPITACMSEMFAPIASGQISAEDVFGREDEELDGLAQLRRLDAATTACEFGAMIEFFSEQADFFDGELDQIGGVVEQFKQRVPDLYRSLVPPIEDVSPLVARDSFRDVYALVFFERFGKAALGLDLIDWTQLPALDSYAHGYPYRNDLISDAALDNLTAGICDVWGDTSHLRTGFISPDRTWKQTGLLVPLTYLEKQCAPPGQRLIAAALQREFGEDVLNALRDYRIPPALVQMIQTGRLDEAVDHVVEAGEKSRMAGFVSILGLFSQPRAGSPIFEDDTEEDLPDHGGVFTVALTPWQQEPPLSASSEFMLSAQRLLYHDKRPVRQAVVDLLFASDPNPDELKTWLLGINGAIDPPELPYFVDLLQLLRYLDTPIARETLSVMSGVELNVAARLVAIEILLDNGERFTAARQIVLLEKSDLPLLRLRDWAEAFLDEDNRITSTNSAEEIYFRMALDHMFRP
ncbi:MAG: hypothetical protein AAGA12_03525 [Pseudomonadota bacterium]